MKPTLLLLSLAGLAASQKVTLGTGQNGPYKAGWWTEPGLPKHTVFGPIDPPAGMKVPVMLWGNGACSTNGLLFQRMLLNSASHGILTIANGKPNGKGGQTNAGYQKQALEWVMSNAGKGKYANVVTRIAAAGQSCGGLEAYKIGADRRVSAIGIFNSGEFTAPATAKTAAAVGKKPVFYFLGGPSDIAYKNGVRDYAAMTGPKWMGQHTSGHMATYKQPNSGLFGRGQSKFLTWMLRGNASSKAYFTGGGAKADGWLNITTSGMGSVNVAAL